MRVRIFAILVMIPLLFAPAVQAEVIASSPDKEVIALVDQLNEARTAEAAQPLIASLEKLAQDGNVEAAFRLGRFYHVTMGDNKKAMQYYTQAEEANHAWAINNMGLIYQDEGNPPLAIKYFERAAALKDVHSYRNLAETYLLGKGVPRDKELALQWLEKGFAAKSPNTYAFAGYAYDCGCYTLKRDYMKALEYYETAGTLGDQDSKLRAAEYYILGKGMKADPQRGVQMLNELIAENYAPAMNRLGELHNEGKGGLEVDHVAALKIWEQAGALKHCRSLMNIGFNHDRGFGVPVDQKIAADYFQKAVDCGNPPDGFDVWKLGTRYMYGTGREQNCTLAGQMFQASMQLGYVQAGVDYGGIFKEGCADVKPDLAKAFQAYLYTAKLGVPLAQNNVGAMLKHGSGVGEADKVRAYAWLMLAKENGDQTAVRNLVEYDSMFSDEERATGLKHLQVIRSYLLPPNGPATGIDAKY